MDKRTIILPVIMITLGAGWLLAALEFAAEVNWVWTLGLAAVGLLTFALYGWDKLTAVVGPLFLTASVLSILRQTGRLRLDVELPILVMLAGVLLLAARHPRIPKPTWLSDNC
ncbi:MAG: hypothetical protein KF688_03820 [Pirellulales bacterium]|nr:hypothetical protein [Pirellulales bacterium]